MVTTNNRNQIKKEIAIVKHYEDKKGYTTKRINLNSKSVFADNERVLIINEDDFNNYYEKSVNLDDFLTDPANEDAIAGLEELQSKYNDLSKKYEDALIKIAGLEKEKAEIKDNHFEELQDQQTKYNLLNSKYAENLSALDNISLESEKAIKSAIAGTVKQTTNYNNNEFANLSLIKRIKKEKLTAPVIEDDKEIFAPAFAEVKKAIEFYKFKKLE